MGKEIKYFVLLALLITMIGLVGAEINNYAPVKQGDCITIKQVCASCTYLNVSISYVNSTIAVNNTGMTNIGGGTWIYEFCNTTTLGRYDVTGSGDLSGTDTGFDVLYFEVSYMGKELSSAKAIMYIGFLSLLVLIFFLNFIGMGLLPKRNQRDEEGKLLSISYLKYFRDVLWMSGYFLFIAITFIASNLAFAFLEEQLVANVLHMIFRIAFGAAPVVVIIWLVWIFVSMFHDKQFQNLLNRGMFSEGRV